MAFGVTHCQWAAPNSTNLYGSLIHMGESMGQSLTLEKSYAALDIEHS